MGGKHGKQSKLRQDGPKDDYLKFIKREQIRREKEYKKRSHDKEIIYNRVKEECKKDELDLISHEELKL